MHPCSTHMTKTDALFELGNLLRLAAAPLHGIVDLVAVLGK